MASHLHPAPLHQAQSHATPLHPTPSHSAPLQPSPASQPQPQRYTLVFRDGQRLRHQDSLSLLQYRSDARLAAFEPEPA